MKYFLKFILIIQSLLICISNCQDEYEYSSNSSSIDASSYSEYYQAPPAQQNYDDDVMTSILKKYNKLIRPVKLLAVDLKISLRQIVSVDEKNQIMTSNIYVSARWTDKRLRWNPYSRTNVTYGNLTETTLPASSVWLPDLFILNIAGPSGFVPIAASNFVLVNYKGQVFLSVSVTNLQTRCKMNVYYFPFDTQNCSIVIGSWLNDNSRINFGSMAVKIDLASYQPNPIWTLKKVVINSIFSSDRFYGGSGLTAEDIAYYFSISRGSSYYMNNLMVCFMLNGVTLVAYFVPFPNQVALCMTAFLTFAVQSVNMANFLPVQSSYYPLISVYFTCSILITFTSLIWFWTCNRFVSQKQMPPKLLEMLSNLIRNLLVCIYKKEKKVEPKKAEMTKKDEIIEVKSLKEPEDMKPIDIPIIKCNKCEMCSKCQATKDKDDKKKKDVEKIESIIGPLNYLACSIMAFILIAVHLSIWLSCLLSK